ncbi:MAG: CARDB domain-containing protein [bacterium]|nr:CARDB domain-containing protein [bacterium]
MTVLPAPLLVVSCSVSPTSASLNQPVTWSATASGGDLLATSQTRNFGNQPLTTTVFDFSGLVGSASVDSFYVSYDWQWEDGGNDGVAKGNRKVNVGQTGLIFSALKDDDSHGVPGPNCLGYTGNSDAYDYCMSIHSSSWNNAAKKLTVQWEGVTDRDINTVTRFNVTAKAPAEHIFSWSGTNGLSGTTASVSKSYSTTGVKTGNVTVTSGSQSVTGVCDNSVSVLGPLPDLTAGPVFPTSATAGTAKIFTSTISNKGSLSTGISFNNFMQVATAPNGSGIVSDTSFVGMAALAAGSANTFSKSHTFVSAGIYSLRVCADKSSATNAGVINEGTNEGNNCGAWTTVTVSNLPDLTAGPVSPNSATVSIATTLSAPVSNIGTGSTRVGFTSLFQKATSNTGANAADIGTFTRSSAFLAGGSMTASLSYTFPSADGGTTRYIRVCADKSSATNVGVITESNENNNCGDWTDVSVLVPPSAFNYNLSNSGNSNVTKASGNAFTTNTITKTLLSVSTQSVTLDVSGEPSGVTHSISNQGCSPRCTSVITFTVPPSTPNGTYLIRVTGSPLNKQTSFNLVVSGNPMSVSCSSSPRTALVGELVTWTASVTGGTPPLAYLWSGTNIPTSPAPTTNPFSIRYSTIGPKTATITVTDTNSVRASCPSTIQINFNPLFEEF